MNPSTSGTSEDVTFVHQNNPAEGIYSREQCLLYGRTIPMEARSIIARINRAGRLFSLNSSTKWLHVRKEEQWREMEKICEQQIENTIQRNLNHPCGASIEEDPEMGAALSCVERLCSEVTEDEIFSPETSLIQETVEELGDTVDNGESDKETTEGKEEQSEITSDLGQLRLSRNDSGLESGIETPERRKTVDEEGEKEGNNEAEIDFEEGEIIEDEETTDSPSTSSSSNDRVYSRDRLLELGRREKREQEGYFQFLASIHPQLFDQILLYKYNLHDKPSTSRNVQKTERWRESREHRQVEEEIEKEEIEEEREVVDDSSEYELVTSDEEDSYEENRGTVKVEEPVTVDKKFAHRENNPTKGIYSKEQLFLYWPNLPSQAFNYLNRSVPRDSVEHGTLFNCFLRPTNTLPWVWERVQRNTLQLQATVNAQLKVAERKNSPFYAEFTPEVVLCRAFAVLHKIMNNKPELVELLSQLDPTVLHRVTTYIAFMRIYH